MTHCASKLGSVIQYENLVLVMSTFNMWQLILYMSSYKHVKFFCFNYILFAEYIC